jgi:ubiquinone/menaquinone biosynthesis C-methylase UbiE
MPITSEIIDSAYREYKAAGLSRIMQPFLFADNELDHVKLLLDIADFKENAVVVDIGCGVGETASIMKMLRPDVNFILLNFSAAQLVDAPDFEKLLADAHDIPLNDCSVDGVMFHAALCNMVPERALIEAVRILKVDGVLLINDLQRVLNSNDTSLEDNLLCTALWHEDLDSFLNSIGMILDKHLNPPVKRYYLRDIWQNDSMYDASMYGVIPGIWRFTKKAR